VRRIILMSSIGVNGNVTHGRPFTESDTPAPVEPYARSKLRAEQAVQEGGVEWVIVRPPLVYGADAPGNFGRLVRAVARGWPLPLASVRNHRSLAGVNNLCEFIVACASQPAAANELFLFADGDDLSTPEMIAAIAHGLQRPARMWNMPCSMLKAAAAVVGKGRIAESLCGSLQVDATKARRVLGLPAKVDSREGIARAAARWSFA
jgi:nucleoside-diphosphate-sugar epimerase